MKSSKIVPDNFYYTMLINAILFGKLDIVKTIHEWIPFDLTFPDNYGRLPIDALEKISYPEIRRTFLEHVQPFVNESLSERRRAEIIVQTILKKERKTALKSIEKDAARKSKKTFRERELERKSSSPESEEYKSQELPTYMQHTSSSKAKRKPASIASGL